MCLQSSKAIENVSEVENCSACTFSNNRMAKEEGWTLSFKYGADRFKHCRLNLSEAEHKKRYFWASVIRSIRFDRFYLLMKLNSHHENKSV